VLLTDGRATGGTEGTSDPLEDARSAARAVADAGIEALVLDAEDGSNGLRLGLAAELADMMNAGYSPLASITATEVESAVRASLEPL
jgi:Mg-chelatase subunit ChlD